MNERPPASEACGEVLCTVASMYRALMILNGPVISYSINLNLVESVCLFYFTTTSSKSHTPSSYLYNPSNKANPYLKQPRKKDLLYLHPTTRERTSLCPQRHAPQIECVHVCMRGGEGWVCACVLMELMRVIKKVKSRTLY